MGVNGWNLEECEEECDTCDSKNDKTPVDACVRARARKGDYRYFYNSTFHYSHTLATRKKD